MQGALANNNYPNLLSRAGLDDAAVSRWLQSAFETLFFDPDQRIYREVDADSACLEDTGNHDARTEGMSYGMMMCVQMDRQDIFDKLWRFSKRYMLQTSGIYEGYFAWSVQLNGAHNAEGPAPDGEEYFAMALLLAEGRWGASDRFDYGADAREILRRCLHQHELVAGGQPMWDPATHHIKFVPEADFTDPSYHLPHFYELFARRANPEDRDFWKQAAEASRRYIVQSAHPVTGLHPEYAEHNGTPRLMFKKPWAYYSDAYRVAMNMALDTLWFGERPEYRQIALHLQRFLRTQLPETNYRAYHLDGRTSDEPAMHPTAITATCAASCIAGWGDDSQMWLERFASLPLRRGARRYYDNCLYFFCLLMLGGRYRVY